MDGTTVGEQGIIADQSATKDVSNVSDFARDVYV